MTVWVLGKLRRILLWVDAMLTRRLFPHPYFVVPANDTALADWREFLDRFDTIDNAGAEYRSLHLDRLARTMGLVPAPGRTGRVLELGCYMQLPPALHMKLGYGEVRGAHLGPAGTKEIKTASIGGSEVFRCEVDLFDAEHDRFPYPDGHFDCLLACEMIEHLTKDPLHLLIESRRVLVSGGALILTTPNCASLGSVTRALHGAQNPQIYSCYPHPASGSAETPHIHEYTPFELSQVLRAAGFRVDMMTTGRIGESEEGKGTFSLLERYGFSTELRGEQIYCRAIRDDTLAVNRYPSFLYDTA